jgi:predicted MFS family arabinose efflux permease
MASERRIIFLVGAIQFVNVLDFMMVMPLGPDFAVSLGISNAQLGLIGGSYTAAAAVTGLVGSFFLDRFDRRVALAVAMLGLALGTLAGAFATGLGTLVLARAVAGAFGGPATSLSLAIVSDVVPPERRGKAFGAVMGAFAVASVLGVPAGLELARQGGWRLPFFAVTGIGIVLTAAAARLLPPLRGHLVASAEIPPLRALARPAVIESYVMTAVIMAGGFALIPNLSAFLQFNLGYPRERLGLLYLVGGAVSFVNLRLVGALVDRYGATRIGTIGSLALMALCYGWFIAAPGTLPVMLAFVLFMVSMTFRNVPFTTVTSKVPGPAERARFMSIQSAVQHLAAAAGAFLSSRMLTELPDKRLAGMGRVAVFSIALTALVPFLLHVVERRVKEGRA